MHLYEKNHDEEDVPSASLTEDWIGFALFLLIAPESLVGISAILIIVFHLFKEGPDFSSLRWPGIYLFLTLQQVASFYLFRPASPSRIRFYCWIYCILINGALAYEFYFNGNGDFLHFRWICVYNSILFLLAFSGLLINIRNCRDLIKDR